MSFFVKLKYLNFFVIDGEEVAQLQERLASTEAQMCKILTALDTASDKVKELSTKPEKTKEEEEEEQHQSIPKSSNGEESSSSLSDEEEEDDDNPSESISSSNLSAEEDQSAPTDEQNRLTKRKHQ